MTKFKNIIALTTMMALFAGQINGKEETAKPADKKAAKETGDDYANDSCEAYCDSGYCSYLSAALPIGALVVAAVLIATTKGHHHSTSNPPSPASVSHSGNSR